MSEEGPAPKSRRGSRQSNVPGGRQIAHKVKVTPEQERRLQERAHDAWVSVPRLMVEEALADQIGQTATARHDLAVEFFGAYRLLASITSNVNQIAGATDAVGEQQEEFAATFAAVRRTGQRVGAALEGQEST